ncbi:hypothetical protein KFK09_010805 [Dendrobium nobile]|uniref:Uncharacterized protein n=1 Tax=Dendrobium nobile TaxID=94219 RepID=A0A8T3BCS5_DENNO|nr:hypothetical protein KFK09_010805 [Dendrobium nobile]
MSVWWSFIDLFGRQVEAWKHKSHREKYVYPRVEVPNHTFAPSSIFEPKTSCLGP